MEWNVEREYTRNSKLEVEQFIKLLKRLCSILLTFERGSALLSDNRSNEEKDVECR